MFRKRTQEQPYLPTPANGKDEMNLAEFPFALLSKRMSVGKKTIEFNDTIKGRGGKLTKREWIVTGSDRFGLPRAGDEELYIALMKMTKDSNFQSRTIDFTKYKLMRIMGWSDQGKNYLRIEEGLKRLKGVSIYAKNAFWDNEAKAYATVSFGIIDNFALYDEHPGRSQKSPPSSSFSWNEILFNSFQAGFIKNIDVDFYFSLKNSISKRLYRFLDKNRYRKPKFEIELLKLAALLPVQDRYSSQIKRRLSTAHSELLKRGFLSDVTYKKGKSGNEKVAYRFPAALPVRDKAAEPAEKLPSQMSEESAVMLQRLEERHITNRAAKALVINYPIDQIQRQIEVFDWLRERKSVLVGKNPAGFLRKSIEENYQPPEEYIEYRDRKAREQEARDRRERWLQHREELIKQDVADWDKTPPEERVKGRLDFWIAMRKLTGPGPTPVETEANRQELIDNLPKTDEEKWEYIALNYPEEPPEDFE